MKRSILFLALICSFIISTAQDSANLLASIGDEIDPKPNGSYYYDFFSSYSDEPVPLTYLEKENEIDFSKISLSFGFIDISRVERPIERITVINQENFDIELEFREPEGRLSIASLPQGSYTVFFRRGGHLVSLQLYKG